MWRGGAAEFVEGVEELVVSAYHRSGDEAAHRKCVDQRVVEMLILEEVRGWDFAFTAFGIW